MDVGSIEGLLIGLLGYCKLLGIGMANVRLMRGSRFGQDGLDASILVFMSFMLFHYLYYHIPFFCLIFLPFELSLSHKIYS